MHTTKGCVVLIDGEEVDGVENDTIIFAPEKSTIQVKNNAKQNTATLKFQLSIYSAHGSASNKKIMK